MFIQPWQHKEHLQKSVLRGNKLDLLNSRRESAGSLQFFHLAWRVVKNRSEFFRKDVEIRLPLAVGIQLFDHQGKCKSYVALFVKERTIEKNALLKHLRQICFDLAEREDHLIRHLNEDGILLQWRSSHQTKIMAIKSLQFKFRELGPFFLTPVGELCNCIVVTGWLIRSFDLTFNQLDTLDEAVELLQWVKVIIETLSSN